MDAESKKLRSELRNAGLSGAAIDAAWPKWWSEEASASPSARAELRFAISRSLGLSPKSLIGERVEFVWRDTARFKNLAPAEGDGLMKSALNSFGVSLGRMLLEVTPEGAGLLGISASELRAMLIDANGVVDLLSLLSACWAVGIPTAHLRVSPLPQKAMHAMVVGDSGRHAILLSKDASYPAITAFTLAHEIGHIALGHVPQSQMLVDVTDPVERHGLDKEEADADRFGLELLMGTADPDIRINVEKFNFTELADAVLRAGPEYGIEPGTLALAVAFRTKAWPVAMAAMRLIYDGPSPVWAAVNQVALSQIDLATLDEDRADFVRRVLGMPDA